MTEDLYEAGAGRHVVGAVKWSDYPPEAKRLPGVGDTYSLDLEAIVALKPDLVVAWQSGNGQANIDRLRALHLPVYVSEPRTLTAVADTIFRLGLLAGTSRHAAARRDAFMQSLDSLRRQFTGRKPVRVFYQIWNTPIFTVNGDHMISHVITLCGGVNVFAALPGLSPQVSIEAVIAADPDIIIASGADARRPAWLDDWKRWPALRAVRHNQLYAIPPDLIQRQTVRLLEGARRMCTALDAARASAVH